MTAVHELDRLLGLRHQFVERELFFDEPSVFLLRKGARIRRIRRTDRGILARPHFRVPADVLDHDARIVATGGVGDHRDALRPAGGQHQILRGPHRGQTQHNFPAPQPRCPTVEHAAGVINLRSQRAQS